MRQAMTSSAPVGDLDANLDGPLILAIVELGLEGLIESGVAGGVGGYGPVCVELAVGPASLADKVEGIARVEADGLIARRVVDQVLVGELWSAVVVATA
ncbi:MAG: hypothetical protein ABFD90_18985 [Phycisphaerales bacterium]